MGIYDELANLHGAKRKAIDEPGDQLHGRSNPGTTRRHTTRKQPTERLNRTVEPNGQTERFHNDIPRAHPEEEGTTILNEIIGDVPEEIERPVERYSFEIYSDLKERIDDVKYQYKRRTGKKLSASRIIREALEVYLNTLTQQLR